MRSRLITVEPWLWFSINVVILIARLLSRTLLFGSFTKLRIEDWVIVLAFLSYTVFISLIPTILKLGTNILPPGVQPADLSPEQLTHRVLGSKLVLVVEQCQLWSIWAVKACLLILYHNITICHRGENLFVKALAVYIAIGLIIQEIFFFGVWCRPLKGYWSIPPPNIQCAAEPNHLIMNAAFNFSSDTALLIMALQMIIRSKFPVQRKMILGGIFGLGIFTVLCAVLNKAFTWINPLDPRWVQWYVRESSTALIVVNLPYTWYLLQRTFNLKNFSAISTRTKESQTIGPSQSIEKPLGPDGSEYERRCQPVTNVGDETCISNLEYKTPKPTRNSVKVGRDSVYDNPNGDWAVADERGHETTWSGERQAVGVIPDAADSLDEEEV